MIKKISKNKKAEEGLPRSMLLILIILAISLVIIMGFLSRWWGGGQEADRETCHFSVIQRATLPDTLDSKDFVPLACETRKVCVTTDLVGKGECKELGSDYDSVRVSSNADKIENEINEFVAQEYADCWGMMGEGKVQVFTRNVQTKKRCVICSRIAFDNSVKEKIQEVKGLGKYMISENVPLKNISYWNYISGGINPKDYNPLLDNFSMNEKAILFSEVDSGEAFGWILGIAGTTGGCYLGAKGGAIIGSIVPGAGNVVGGVIGCIGGGLLQGYFGEISGESIDNALAGSDYVAGNFFTDYRGVSDLGCDSLENIP